MLRAMAGEPVGRDRYRIVTAKGETREVEAAATPIVLDGRDMVLGVIEDVTERLRFEDELQASELRFRALVQNSKEWVAIIGTDGTIGYAGASTMTVLGRPAEELTGTRLADLVHPDDRSALVSRLQALHRQADGQSTVGTYRLRHADDQWRHIELILSCHVDNPVINGCVVNGRDVSDRVAADADLRRLALHDPLTGLANRALVEERIGRGLQQMTAVRRTAVVAIDLDSFKDINDTFGHAIGDVVLSEIAERLRRAVRSDDTVGRPGGDEFVLVFPGVERIRDARNAVQRILDAIEEPIVHDGQRFRITASAGLAFGPEHGTDSDSLLRAADAAMYRAKRDHRGVALFNEHDRERSHERLALTTELADAVEHDEFVLHYQPKYDLTDGRLTGVEALLRWQHPTRGLVPPDEFLPLAEDTGLMRPITSWVLDNAVAQGKRWYDAGSELTVALNLSPSSLQDPGFVDEVRSILKRHGLPAERLVLEVTEQTVMANSEAAREVMRALTRVGVSFSIDDFGTGYSSLTYLRILPVGELKIDRTFIRDANGEIDLDIVETIVTLGRRLGLRVVAEGIETPEAADELRAIGCEVGQGFLLGRPAPAEQLDVAVPYRAPTMTIAS